MQCSFLNEFVKTTEQKGQLDCTVQLSFLWLYKKRKGGTTTTTATPATTTTTNGSTVHGDGHSRFQDKFLFPPVQGPSSLSSRIKNPNIILCSIQTSQFWPTIPCTPIWF